jgi:putative Mg2+ transporter-C (MgtC) family protein
MITTSNLLAYWTGDHLAANGFIALNLLGALLLGMLVGYERSYQGRAAGMRTYGLVCMAAAALTVFGGFAPLWFGTTGNLPADPTRIVQGVVTGIGFLCAGVIMRDGLSIHGLNTAASIWAVAAVGVLLGVGFYAAAILLAVLSALAMSLLRRLEARLPGRSTLDVQLKFRAGHAPRFDDLSAAAVARGHEIVRESLVINFAEAQAIWRFSVVSIERSRAASHSSLAEELARAEGIDSFTIAPVRL